LNLALGTGAPAGAAVQSQDNGGAIYAAVRNQVAGQYANAMILAPIDPGGNIYLKNTSETSFQLWVLLLAYA
jgi:hypothetical protein